jgi:hypothetical protein
MLFKYCIRINNIFLVPLCFVNRAACSVMTQACLYGMSRLTGHCHLKEHIFKLGLTDDPTCERCPQEDESATHILCHCEAIAYLRFRHLSQFFIEPSDFYDAPIFKVLHFIRIVGLIKD